MNHLLSKTFLINDLIELISKNFNLSIDEARNTLYKSNLVDLINDDETDLYGESALYLFSLYEEIVK